MNNARLNLALPINERLSTEQRQSNANWESKMEFLATIHAEIAPAKEKMENVWNYPHGT